MAARSYIRGPRFALRSTDPDKVKACIKCVYGNGEHASWCQYAQPSSADDSRTTLALPSAVDETPQPDCVRALKCDDLGVCLAAQMEWSAKVFGPSLRTEGICKHIARELEEIRLSPHDLSEWIDVVILALDGYWRHGGNPQDVMRHLLEKQAKNFARQWPYPPPPDHEPSLHIKPPGFQSANAAESQPASEPAEERQNKNGGES